MQGRVVSDRVTSSLLLLNKVQLHSASVLFSMQAFVSPCSLLRTAGWSNGWSWLSVKWPSRFIDHLGAVDYSQSYRIIAVWFGMIKKCMTTLVKRPHWWDSSCFISFSQRSMPSSAKLHIRRVWDSLVRSKLHLGPTGVGQRNMSDLLWHFKGPQRHCREAPICAFEILFRRLSFVARRWNLCNTASGLCEDAFKFASVGFRFIQNAFKGGKYLSAHCRRTDQLRMTIPKMIWNVFLYYTISEHV